MLKSINNYRRFILKVLTRHVGKANEAQISGGVNLDIRHILVCRPNHRLGNMLLVTPLIIELSTLFPNSRIDIFVKGPVAREIFRNYPNITVLALPKKHFREIFTYLSIWFRLRKHRYDLVVNAIPYSSSGRLATRFSRGHYKYYGNSEGEEAFTYEDHQHIAKSPIWVKRVFGN